MARARVALPTQGTMWCPTCGAERQVTRTRNPAIATLALMGFCTCGLSWLAIPFAMLAPEAVCTTCRRPITARGATSRRPGGSSFLSDLTTSLGAAAKGFQTFWAGASTTQRRWIVAGAAGVVLLSLLSAAATSVEKQRAEARAAESARLEAEAEAAEAERKETALRADAPNVAAALRDDLAAYDEAIARQDAQAADATDARWRARFDPYNGVVADPGIDAVVKELNCRSTRRGLDGEFDRVDRDVASKAYDDAERRLTGVVDAVQRLRQDCPAYAQAPEIAAVAARAERGLRAVAPKAARERSAEKAKADEAERLRQTCGARPEVSAWDGGIPAAVTYLKESAHDPDSIEVTDCTVPVLTDGCWRSRCKVRGKNAFGGKVLHIVQFFLVGGSSGYEAKVLAAENVE